jgi:hypothetical protein
MRGRLCVGTLGLIFFGAVGCGDSSTASPVADASAPDATTLDSGVSDATSADSGVSAEALQIEALLEDPSPIQGTTAESPAFGDAELQALVAREPAPLQFGTTPDENGYLADASEGPFISGRPHVFVIHMSAVGGPVDTLSLTSSIATDVGVVMPRRIWDVEPGDAFLPRASPPTVGTLKRLDFQLGLPPGDWDNLTTMVFLGAATDANLSFTFSGRTLDVDTTQPPANPMLLALDNGATVSIALQRDPRGACVATRPILLTRAFDGTRGTVGSFRGVLHQDGTHVGFVRGVFGRAPRSDRDVLYLKAIQPSGQVLWTGAMLGPLTALTRVGRLRNGATSLGTFTSRGLVTGDGVSGLRAELALEAHTDCR